MAIAAEWSTRITTVSVEMVLPALGGYWLDRRFGSLPWLTLLGVLLGMTLGGWQLMRLVRQSEREGRSDSESPRDQGS